MTSTSNRSWQTLVELVAERQEKQGEKVAFAFMDDGENVTDTLSFAGLARRAWATAAVLSRRFPVGSRLVLLYPSCLDYMVAFFGCLCAGMIAVPMFPPRRKRRNLRLEAIAQDSGAVGALTTSSQLERIRAALDAAPLLAKLEVVCTDSLGEGSVGEWRRPHVHPDTLALLQYTSGSTGQPKGVMVTHGNLLHNERMIQAAFRSDESSVLVTWAPIYHDMGLVGCMLHAFWLGITCYFMEPVAFLQKPVRWLRAISQFRGTVTGAPNFAYELCAEKVRGELKEGLDLSCWKVAFNGSEPVRYSTMQRFSEAYRSVGFSDDAWLPCYGMAEATLAISGGNAQRDTRVLCLDKTMLGKRRIVQTAPGSGRPLVGCGNSLPGQTVRIVDPSTLTPCVPGCIGEVWLAGPHVSQGYWERPELSRETFGARIAGLDQGPFLRTGDLGFLHDDEIYIAGRIKDVMIVRGANHYPQDIEATVENACAELTPAGAAAFSVKGALGESVVIVAEVRRTSARTCNRPRLVGLVRERVFEQHELMLDDVVLIRQGSLPKTSSGKVQRGQARQLYLSGELALVDAAEQLGTDDLSHRSASRAHERVAVEGAEPVEA